MGRGGLTDAEWERLRPFLPVSNRRCGRWRDHRQVIDGILHRVRTGVHWRDLPERFGPWKTVYERHRLWSADGMWERLLQQIQAEADTAGEIDWDVSVDSTIVRAHQHAAGARNDPPPTLASYYEEHGLLHPERTSNGYRTYGSEAVRIVENIRLLLAAGLTTEDLLLIDGCLRDELLSDHECADPRAKIAVFEQRLAVIQQRIGDLTRVRNQLLDRLGELRRGPCPSVDTAGAQRPAA
uniref:IS5 family transposase n=1 Tax=Streptomyces sp. TR1341 TaxID=2601266 RepID=UPI00138AE1CA